MQVLRVSNRIADAIIAHIEVSGEYFGTFAQLQEFAAEHGGKLDDNIRPWLLLPDYLFMPNDLLSKDFPQDDVQDQIKTVFTDTAIFGEEDQNGDEDDKEDDGDQDGGYSGDSSRNEDENVEEEQEGEFELDYKDENDDEKEGDTDL